jgi:RNA polymerase sigma-70 factor (ECF subfamily)
MKPECFEYDLKHDDPQAMVQLYKSYWKPLYTSAYKILKDKQACEDIIQDVFVQIWHKRSEIQINTSLQAYLSAAVRYAVFRKIRELKKYEPIAEEMADLFIDLSATNTIEYKECLQGIAQVVGQLPEKCREVYLLSREQHLSHKEISDKLSISTNTVRNHLTRALRQLRVEIIEIILIAFCSRFF